MQCSFCGLRYSPAFRHIRTRTSQYVVEELKHLHQTYSYTGFFFADDEINIPKNFIGLMQAIVEIQERLGVDFRLRAFVKSELFTDEQARWMYRAGFRNLLTGFESGSERILTNIRKMATRDQNTRCIEIAHRHGLKVKALMSLGNVGETSETIEETKQWLLEVQPEDFDATVISVYPATPYHANAICVHEGRNIWCYEAKNGDKLFFEDIDFTEETAYYKGIPGEYKSYVFTDALTAEEIVHLRNDLEAEVRHKLNIPYYQIKPAMVVEHSMGMSGGS